MLQISELCFNVTFFKEEHIFEFVGVAYEILIFILYFWYLFSIILYLNCFNSNNLKNGLKYIYNYFILFILLFINYFIFHLNIFYNYNNWYICLMLFTLTYIVKKKKNVWCREEIEPLMGNSHALLGVVSSILVPT